MSQRHFFFCYGTLKEGEPNSHVMTDPSKGSAVFIGVGHTSKKYPLVVGSQYGIPFLLLAEGEGKNVQGEVYEIDEQMLSSLDKLESHPVMYRREMAPVTITNGKDKEKLSSPYTQDCWIYFQHEFTPEMLRLPHVTSYTASAKGQLPYIEQQDRPPDAPTDKFYIPT